MLHTEFKYYRDHHEKLLKKFANKFIVIKREKIIGVYNSHPEAYKESVKTEELETFLIQHCLSGKESH